MHAYRDAHHDVSRRRRPASSPSRPPSAQSVAEFYAGKQITLIVGSTPGGGYDTQARLVARHIGRHIPGNPTVIVQNMPAAGSLAATNHMFNIAPKDGSTIALVQRGMLLIKNWNPSAVRFELGKFNFLGSINREVALSVVARRRAGEDHGAAVHHRADHRRDLRHRPGDHAAAAQRADRHQIQARDGLSRRHRDRAGDGAQRGAGARRLVGVEPEDRAADLARREEDQPADADRAARRIRSSRMSRSRSIS